MIGLRFAEVLRPVFFDFFLLAPRAGFGLRAFFMPAS